MKCPNCKQEIENGSVFCEYCGKQVNNYANSQSVQHSTTPKRNRTWILWGIISILAISTGCLGYMYYEADSRAGTWSHWFYKLRDGIKMIVSEPLLIKNVEIKNQNQLYLDYIFVDNTIDREVVQIYIYNSNGTCIVNKTDYFYAHAGYNSSYLTIADEIRSGRTYKVEIWQDGKCLIKDNVKAIQ